MHTFTHTCKKYRNIQTQTYLSSNKYSTMPEKHIYALMCTHTSTCTHVYLSTEVYTCVQLPEDIHQHTFKDTNMQVHVLAHTCKHMYTCVHIRI